MSPVKTLAIALDNGLELRQYRIIETLGQGGFSITYLARDLEKQEDVVIKENLPTDFAHRDSHNLHIYHNGGDKAAEYYAWSIKNFLHEAQLLNQLQHPNIVPILNLFEDLGTAYYVMPLIPGRELHLAAPLAYNITEEWLKPILIKILTTLRYLHENNLLHRDLKPANILLTDEQEPILIDFGSARAILSDHTATKLQTTGYSPPEQVHEISQHGPWTDIYALGATCYRLITGACPPDSINRVLHRPDSYRKLSATPSLFKRFSKKFLFCIDKALNTTASERWQHVDEWLQALQQEDTPQHKQSSTYELVPGTEINQYRIIKTLGIGGFAITYQALHVESKQNVVIKEHMPMAYSFRDADNFQVIPNDQGQAQEEYRWSSKNFYEEAEKRAQAYHLHAVEIYKIFHSLNTVYYVMPYLQHMSLAECAPAPQDINETWLAPVLNNLLDTLQHLHQNDILHRNIKPSNIMISDKVGPILIDFNAAFSIVSSHTTTQLQQEGYTPLEQLQPNNERGPWTDIYALGATCYRLICGQRPAPCMARFLNDDKPYISLTSQTHLHERFSVAFLAGIDKALHLQPKQRWQSAKEWQEALVAANKKEEPTPQRDYWKLSCIILLILMLIYFIYTLI